jgi:predicted amidohydrolase
MTTFTVGLVQMRSGLDPARNLDAAVALIQQAKANGADYVQTPEMTNIVANKRDAMLAAVAEEERDASLAAFRG